MKSKKPTPRWMRTGRPDEIYAQCMNVHDGIVEACDFDSAMCQACETDACKWHPSRLGDSPPAEDANEDDDDDANADETAEEADDGNTDSDGDEAEEDAK